MYFPPSFFDIMVHLMVHIVPEIQDLGPAFLHEMYALERFNGVVKRFVRNRSQPDGSIIQGYLTEECIDFCTDFMAVEKPIGVAVSKHKGRLGGRGHRRGTKDIHVFQNDPPRDKDRERAHTVLLQHIRAFDDYSKKHINMIETENPTKSKKWVTDKHNETFEIGRASCRERVCQYV